MVVRSLFILFLLVNASCLVASDVTFSLLDNGDGTLTVGYSAWTPLPAAAIGFVLEDANTVIQNVYSVSPDYDLIRFIDPNSMRLASFALLSSYTGKSFTLAPSGDLFVIEFVECAKGTLAIADALGAFDSSGAGLGHNLPLAFSVTNPAECLGVGDIIGGVTIEPAMVSLWQAMGRPVSWCRPCHKKGDSNGDGVVTGTDVDMVAESFNSSWENDDGPYDPGADFNMDGFVTGSDVQIMTSGFGETCLDNSNDCMDRVAGGPV